MADRLGIDIDDGVSGLLSTVFLLKHIGIEMFDIYTTTLDGEDSHFHIVTGEPTCIPLRVFLGDDPNRITCTKLRGRNDDILFEYRGNRKRIKVEEHITKVILNGKTSF